MPTATDLVRAIARARITSPHRDRTEFLAHIDDHIWELVGGGPQGLRSRVDLVALNPQPLPPVDSGRLLLQLMDRGIIVVGGGGGDRRELSRGRAAGPLRQGCRPAHRGGAGLGRPTAYPRRLLQGRRPSRR